MPKSIHRPEYDLLRRLIRELREGCGVTQVELSTQMGRTQSFISDIERGVRRVDLIELRDMCRLMDSDLKHFVQAYEARLAQLPAAKSNARLKRSARPKPA